MHKNSLRPWITMWFNPRKTIRQVVKTNPNAFIPALAALLGLASALDNAISRNLGDRLAPDLLALVIVVGGIVGGFFSLYVGSWVLRWIGQRLGGSASVPAVRAAVAWSSLPQLAGMGLNLVSRDKYHLVESFRVTLRIAHRPGRAGIDPLDAVAAAEDGREDRGPAVGVQVGLV